MARTKYPVKIFVTNMKVAILVFILSYYTVTKSLHIPDKCDKFFLAIENEPLYFVPRSSYIVGIESNDIHTFTTFYLKAESLNHTLSDQIGWFSLMSEENDAEFSLDAINTIVEKSDSEKQSIHVLWTAPSSHNCLFFKAEINYQVKQLKCKQKLERKFCPLNQNNKNLEASSNIECCACDEASYSLTFEGLWSNETHPKGFPSAIQLTHFSDIVGCTHHNNVTMWAEDQYATEGLRQIAEFGSASIIQSELLEKKKYLRSLIKMSGLWYPRMNSNTSTTFRVDRYRNLLSIATMLGPSPDWFTGISKLNLCTKDCTWIENKIVNLSLYDAGTDSGITYMSPNSPTVPQERVYRITTNYPEDPRAPFYNMNGNDIKPIARLYLRRDRVTKKSCIQESNFDAEEQLSVEDDKRRECSVTNYTDWSPCSATCGKGFSIKTRKYIYPEAQKLNCNRQIMQKKLCMADISCPNDSDDDSILLSDEHCKTTEWSEWSECTATCGIGFMTRTRRFLKHSGFKKCKHITIYEQKKCMEPPCKTTTVEKEMLNCSTTEWTDWSPCTATCGTGWRIRIRYLSVPHELREFCRKNVKLEEKRECVRTSECVIDKTHSKEICELPKEKGLCRGTYERWYFNFDTKQCTEFNYGGCRGNKNNFLTLDECIKICSGAFT